MPRSVSHQRIIQLCLVTAQRVGEIAGLVPAELDLAAREWRLPGARAKNAHAHIVPLSDLAIGILREAIADAGDGPLFPSVSSQSLAESILRANKAGRFGIAPWTAHDLRRSALTGMARLGVQPIVLGHVANHRSTTRAGVTLAVYSQYAYDKEKRAALELWADRLVAIIGAGAVADVLPFGRTA
jgi:integrase